MTHPLVKYRADNGRQSQEALAKKLEVSSVTVSRWETGARKIGRSVLPRIVERTGIPATELRPDLAELMAPAEPAQ